MNLFKRKKPPKYNCCHCGSISNDDGDYCPACGKDKDGYTHYENMRRFNLGSKSRPETKIKFKTKIKKQEQKGGNYKMSDEPYFKFKNKNKS